MSKFFLATVRVEGRITIPKEIREVYNIKRGDIVQLRFVRVEREGKEVKKRLP